VYGKVPLPPPGPVVVVVVAVLHDPTPSHHIARKTVIGRAVEVVQGVVTGDAPAVGKLGEISENEISEWRSSH